MSRRLSALLALPFLLTLSGCPKDPYEASTWIEHLDDAAEWDKARVQLERLKDPKAIKPLAKAWERYNRNPKILRTIISLADQPDKEGGPFWGDAMEVLTSAVDEYDSLKLRSIDDAVVAAEALGRAGDPAAIDTLVRAAFKTLPALNEGQRVRVAAVGALGQFPQSPKAVDALIKVLETEPTKIVDGKPTNVQPPYVNREAAKALAATGSKKALQPLVTALYGIPLIYRQVLGALVRLRKDAGPEMLKVLTGGHDGINAYARDNNFANDCQKAEGPTSKCKAPGNVVFKAAAVLGDMRYKKAAGALAAQLSKPQRTAFFNPKTREPGPPDHTAVLDALRKIADPSTAKAVHDYMIDDKTDDTVRPIAIDVFSFLGDGKLGMEWLATQMKSSQDDETLRAAALSYSRMVYDAAQMAPIDYMVKGYADKAAAERKKAAAAKAANDQTLAERRAADYDGFRLLFLQQRTRAWAGVHCKKDLNCYLGLLDKKTSEVLEAAKIAKADQEKMGRGDRDAFRIAVAERALMEIGKMGTKAKAAQEKLLKLAGARERIIRQGALLALAHVAPEECKECETALARIVESQSGQNTLSELTAETQLLHYYYIAK